MEEKLREMMHQMPVPDAESGLSRTIALAKIEAGRQKRSERISFARFFWLQGKYVGWKIWAAQLCNASVDHGADCINVWNWFYADSGLCHPVSQCLFRSDHAQCSAIFLSSRPVEDE